ncbi:MAG: thrombospondin type 3 repeat-containing protein, partial [Nanoarchaeota archaeon]|nr:thrombospondin type 3 repeat-containing protein [Nanoarchaeota archaeon]
MDSLESQVESIEPKKTSLFNSVYSSVKKGVGKAVITGLALATLYSPMAYAAPQNSGVDTDRDGLSDSYELANGPTDPNNPSSSNSWEFNDNLGITDANIIPSFGFGFSAFNYHEITPAVTPEKDKNDFALSVSRDNRTIYFIRAKGDGAKPVLYMVERGKPGSAVKLTVEGDLGEFYDYQSGTPNFDDSGVILCTRDTGLSSGGKLVEVLKTGSVKDFLVFSDGRKALDPYIHRYGGTTGDILFVSVKESISNPNCVINAYPIVSGLPNASDERKIVSNMGKILRWPVVRGDGKVLAGTKIVSATQFIAGFFGSGAPYSENLEEKVLNPSGFPDWSSFGVDNGPGAMFVGFFGDAYGICQDFLENKFDIVANNLAESDFDIRITSPAGNHIIKYVGNQFMPRVSSDGITLFSDDTDGDGFLELYNASLESKVVH